MAATQSPFMKSRDIPLDTNKSMFPSKSKSPNLGDQVQSVLANPVIAAASNTRSVPVPRYTALRIYCRGWACIKNQRFLAISPMPIFRE